MTTSPLPAEARAIAEQVWPPEALDRLIHAIRFGDPECEGDDTAPVATPELDAIDQLANAISAVRAQLVEPVACMQLRRDDDLPATPEQRAVARTAVWELRVAVAKVLFALSFDVAQ
jgi:hypothetical protein